MINKQEQFQRILDRALFLLSMRMHSCFELSQKLDNKFSDNKDIIQEVISELIRTGILDDLRFSKEYMHYRLTTSPRGGMLIKAELSKKGIAGSVIEQALSSADIDELSSMKKLAINKMKSYDKKLSMQKKREKLTRFLASRGFKLNSVFDVVKEVVRD